MDWGWVGNEGGPDRRIGHEYDSALLLGQALEAKIGVMEWTCLKQEYGLMDGMISGVSRVHRLSVLLITLGFSWRLNFLYKRLAPTGAVPCSLFPTSTMSSPTPSHSPMLALQEVKELSKQLKIARKRQEAEHAA